MIYVLFDPGKQLYHLKLTDWIWDLTEADVFGRLLDARLSIFKAREMIADARRDALRRAPVSVDYLPDAPRRRRYRLSCHEFMQTKAGARFILRERGLPVEEVDQLIRVAKLCATIEAAYPI